MNGMIHPVPDHTLPDNCEREPIRVPGSIQPHGALLAFDPMTGAVLHSSDNLGQFLSLGSLPVHDRFLADMMEPGAAQAVMDSVRQSTQGSTNTPLKLRVASPLGGADGELDAAVHVYRGVGFLEVEAALDDPVDWLPTFTETMQSMRDCSSVEALMSHVAGRVKRLSGFDQVMVYRFDESWNGQVIAERCEADMEPFLGLHYPASDIPPQARDLYLTNLVRLIVDTQYVPVPVRPQVDVRTSQPLDMSHAQLRSVSPMHLQYLQNMGVRSTLVMSIVVEGRLWGLISCHHRKPRRVSMVLRNACKLLVLSLGYLLTAQLQIQTQRHRQSLAEMQVQLLKAFNQPHVPLSDIVESVATELLQLGSAAAGLLWHGHEVHAFGPGVGGEQGRQLVEAIQQALQLRPGDPLFLTRPTPELEGMMSGLGFCGLGALALGPFAD